MDVVIEVRDARIPMATSHPQVASMSIFLFGRVPDFGIMYTFFFLDFWIQQMDLWLGNRKKILVLNREDMISNEDRNAWASYFSRQGIKVVFANGQLGMVCKISQNSRYIPY